uniref:Uncharacterized protein n=1 Tax=Anguilla anguilla TaxID=7936 RepID=A0A0E9TLX0_ANGAN
MRTRQPGNSGDIRSYLVHGREVEIDSFVASFLNVYN